MASTLGSIIANTGVNLSKGMYQLFARDRNVLIPLDNPTKTQVLSDIELKNKFCKSKTIERNKKPPKKKRNSNLDRILERLDRGG